MTFPKMLKNDECLPSCQTCESLMNEYIYYEGHIIRYLKSQCEIDNLSMGTVLMDDLEKVGCVMLKCGFTISANSREQNYLYYLNNHVFNKKEYKWNSIQKQTDKYFTTLPNKTHEKRFIENLDISNNINENVQSDCDVINKHLNERYDFDIVHNKYQSYLPNLMRHYGYVEKDQNPYSDYACVKNHMKKVFASKK